MSMAIKISQLYMHRRRKQFKVGGAHHTGGNFHLKVGGAKSSGNAGDPGRWSKIVLLQKDLFFFF